MNRIIRILLPTLSAALLLTGGCGRRESDAEANLRRDFNRLLKEIADGKETNGASTAAPLERLARIPDARRRIAALDESADAMLSIRFADMPSAQKQRALAAYWLAAFHLSLELRAAHCAGLGIDRTREWDFRLAILKRIAREPGCDRQMLNTAIAFSFFQGHGEDFLSYWRGLPSDQQERWQSAIEAVAARPIDFKRLAAPPDGPPLPRWRTLVP